jgi:hypothetical protein
MSDHPTLSTSNTTARSETQARGNSSGTFARSLSITHKILKSKLYLLTAQPFKYVTLVTKLFEKPVLIVPVYLTCCLMWDVQGGQ